MAAVIAEVLYEPEDIQLKFLPEGPSTWAVSDSVGLGFNTEPMLGMDR